MLYRSAVTRAESKSEILGRTTLVNAAQRQTMEKGF